MMITRPTKLEVDPENPKYLQTVKSGYVLLIE